jgi:hypothetical protein
MISGIPTPEIPLIIPEEEPVYDNEGDDQLENEPIANDDEGLEDHINEELEDDLLEDDLDELEQKNEI